LQSAKITYSQRAFRERKERHVKDLEQKLNTLEQSSSSLLADNERLKRELQKVATENEILRATGINGASLGEANGSVVGPMSYSPSEFYSNLLRSHDNKTPSHRITISDTTGERLLGAGATWDAIQEHTLFKRGLVDVGDVCDRLKNLAKCDGQGPVFEERDIRMAIEQSAASGSDELI
jgi:AP-1-like factor